MDVFVERAPAYVSAARIVFAAAGPAQKLVQRPALTHVMCNLQAKIILFKDGFGEFAEIVDEFALYLNKGVIWADQGFRNMSHFLNPRTLRGLYGWTDAARECGVYWNKAVKDWRRQNFEKAFFNIGAAIHLVQDLCVPHHAMGILFDGHQEYEDWAEANRDEYKVEENGIYELGKYPADWLRSNAIVAAKRYHLVRGNATEQNYHKATVTLLPRAQRVTAGFLHYFLSKMEL
ncbi:MAG: zinc dependent phospholipase C family protein [Eubacteriales bacterium]